MKFSLVSLIAAVVSAGAGDVFSHADLKIAPGGYDKMPDEFKEWFESNDEKDKATSSHIRMIEVEGQANPSLVFVDINGKDLETVFVSYIPISMTKDLIKDKKWAEKPNEEL